ncbi:MAG TPA: aldo/keto reductase [Candidatus Stercorousia faecigallinarum]|nr:aldo/keto reductase [Candidatus Stercorousia faecigallinarum]
METVKLNNGVKMPVLGYGVYQVTPEECEKCVGEAIDVGYRLIDTAQAYYNEEGVGSAIKKSSVKREDIFLVTKIWVSNAGEQKAAKSIDESLKKLQTDYVDLLLIHQPFGDYYGTYRAIENAYKAGKARAIGVSNFYPDRFVDLSNFCEIQPAINQVETHIFQQQKTAREIMKKYNTQIMSWGPFAEGRNNMFKNETLVSIGEKYEKSSAQVALRFLTQEGIIVIPKSVKKERMEQNINIFDFKLDENEINQIRNLDQEQSLFFSHYDPATVEMIIGLAKN